jgi:hypothetical protein
MSTVHTFVSGIADGADATLVRASNWNAAHTVSGLQQSDMVLGADETIAAGHSAVAVSDLEIGSGFVLEIGAGSVLEIT